MAEVPATSAAMFLGAGHAKGGILPVSYGVGERLPEAWPAGAAIELRGRAEQGQCASGAGEQTLSMLVQQWAGEWRLGASFPEDMEPPFAQTPAPVSRAALHLEIGGVSGRPAAKKHDR